MERSTPERNRGSINFNLPDRDEGDVFQFKNNKIIGFGSSEEQSSDSEFDPYEDTKHTIKDTIFDEELLKLNEESDDADYTFQLTDESDDERDDALDLESESSSRLFDELSDIKRQDRDNSFIFEYSDDFDSDEFDDSQYEFEPIRQRVVFWKLGLSYSPYILLGFFTLLLGYNVISFIICEPTKVVAENENIMIQHKIMILEDQVSQMMSIKNEVQSLRTQLSSILNTKSIDENTLIQKINDKVQSLEKRIDAGSSIEANQLKTVSAEQPISVNAESKSKMINYPHPPASHYNIAKYCQIDPKLTTNSYVERKRKTIGQKVLYGYADLIRRIKSKMLKTDTSHQSWWQAISAQKISVFNETSSNSPFNVLKEEPNKLWTNNVTDLPVYLSLKFDDPVKLSEIGIYQSRVKSLLDSSVREVSLYVQPPEKLKQLKAHLKNHVDQSPKSSKLDNQLKNWARLATMEYDINSSQTYQRFSFNHEWVSEWKIQRVLIVVLSNWGNSQKVVFNSLRIFQEAEEGQRAIESQDDVPYL